MKLYLDTSVIGGYFDDEFSENTIPLFDEIFKGLHNIVISKVTIEELESAPIHVRELVKKVPIIDLEIVDLSPEADLIANAYLNENVLSRKYFADALHIAVATLNRVDIIVSWNFKHMVNINKINLYNSVNLKLGYPVIDIRTPKEVINETK